MSEATKTRARSGRGRGVGHNILNWVATWLRRVAVAGSLAFTGTLLVTASQFAPIEFWELLLAVRDAGLGVERNIGTGEVLIGVLMVFVGPLTGAAMVGWLVIRPVAWWLRRERDPDPDPEFSRPWNRIMDAAEARRGVRLSGVECAWLADFELIVLMESEGEGGLLECARLGAAIASRLAEAERAGRGEYLTVAEVARLATEREL